MPQKRVVLAARETLSKTHPTTPLPMSATVQAESGTAEVATVPEVAGPPPSSEVGGAIGGQATPEEAEPPWRPPSIATSVRQWLLSQTRLQPRKLVGAGLRCRWLLRRPSVPKRLLMLKDPTSQVVTLLPSRPR